MNEIRRNKRVVNIMPGLDMSTGDVKAFPIGSALIAGNWGTGADMLFNSIMTHLVMFNSPKDVSIEYFTDTRISVWLCENRKIPHFSDQCYDVDKMWERIKNICIILADIEAGNVGDEEYHGTNAVMLKHQPTVLAIDGLDRMIMYNDMGQFHSRIRMIEYLLDKGPKYGVYLIAKVDDVLRIEQFARLFMMGMTTYTDEHASDIVLGCNLAHTNIREYENTFWLHDRRTPDTFQKMSIKYYPETFMSKLTKLYSNNKKITTEYYSKLIDLLESGKYSMQECGIMHYAIELAEDFPNVDSKVLEDNWDRFSKMSCEELKEAYIECVTRR